MERKETNRARQLSIDKEFQKGVKIIDVDTAIADYMSKVIIPDLEENGNLVKVPLIYGNAERWTNARQQGYLRDQRGKVQIPLVMFKRNSIEKDENLPHFREVITKTFVQKYSKKNRYDKFSIMTGAKPTYEVYSVSIPAYVTVVYEVVVWTSFTEHMNKIIEQFQNESEKYWGNVDGFKFRSVISSFETSQDLTGGSERIIRTTFNINVSAYLLPDQVNEKPTVKKSFTPKRIVFGFETDLSGDLFTGANLYNEYSDIINFVAIRGSQIATIVNANTAKLTCVRKPLLPSELIGVFDTDNWFQIYINGDFISPSFYTYTFSGGTNEIIFTFTGLSYSLEANDEVAITGKFQELDDCFESTTPTTTTTTTMAPVNTTTTTTTTAAPTTTTTTTAAPTTTTTTIPPTTTTTTTTTTLAPTTLNLGDFALGGIVGHIIPFGFPGHVFGKQSGYIITPTDISTAATWGCRGTSIITSDDINQGQQNTNLILSNCATPGIAARLCNDLVLNGYSDWYLPSLEELIFISQSIGNLLNLPNANYWTSSQLRTFATFARIVNLFTSSNNYIAKDSNARVRAIRYFSI